MRCEKDGEVGWTPIVRRRKSARSEDRDSGMDLKVSMNLKKGKGLVGGGWDPRNIYL